MLLRLIIIILAALFVFSILFGRDLEKWIEKHPDYGKKPPFTHKYKKPTR